MERHTKIGKYPFTDEEVAELREYFGEQIAKEIEAIMPADESNTDISFKIWNTVVEQCAAIVRGNNGKESK
jgi:hypothetical protein